MSFVLTAKKVDEQNPNSVRYCDGFMNRDCISLLLPCDKLPPHIRNPDGISRALCLGSHKAKVKVSARQDSIMRF